MRITANRQAIMLFLSAALFLVVVSAGQSQPAAQARGRRL